MNIGQRIRARRTELNMSMEQLAQRLGVNRSTVFRYETGEIEKMPIDVIKPIAKALNTTPAFIMGWDEEELDAVASSHEDSLQDLGSVDKAINDELLVFAESWMQEVGEIHFNDEEYKQITNYAKFVLNQRN